jgi:hypothetical protein
MTIPHSLLAMLMAFLIMFSGPVTARQGLDIEKARVEISGFPLSLSPDGAWIAGLDPEGRAFCVWNVDSMEPVCDGELPDLVEVTSLTWSPDSTAVTFSLGSVNRLMDSDIYVFETGSGALHNLTDDDVDDTGADKVTLITPQANPVAIDRFPAWSPDGQSLLFARTLWGDPDTPGVTLMTIARSGGDPEELFPIEDAAPLSIVGPMTWRHDGSFLFSTRHPDPRHEMNAVWTIGSDGTRTRLLDGTAGSGITEPVIADITSDGTTASVYSRLNLLESLGRPESEIFFHVDLKTGTITPWEQFPGVDLDADAAILAPPVFGPDNAVAFLSRTPDGDMTLSTLDASGTFIDVATVEYELSRMRALGTSGIQPTVMWSQDGTLLVILVTGGTLLFPVHDSASPVATPMG